MKTFLTWIRRWKADAIATIERLKAAVDQLVKQNNQPDLARHDNSTHAISRLSESEQEPAVQTPSPLTTDHSESANGNFTPEGPSTGLHMSHDSDLLPLPMNNLYNLTDPSSSQLIRVNAADANGPDFISQGVLSVTEAEFLFNHYRLHINPLLWDGILCSHKSLHEARQSSSLMVAVVLTVAALHIPNRDDSLRATYGAFVSLMRGSCLLRCQNLDVIRALCIGAFYLTSLSWALCSRAVRVATEMNLHKSSLQFARGSLDSYERVQLWYVLYVCDHQFALAYGRPPMMHEDAAIRNAEKLLTSGLSSKGDRGLVAQVKLFRILATGYFMHGCDPDLELKGQDFKRLREFNISVEQWRLEHEPRETGPAMDGSMSSHVTTLYYHLARFQLNSVSLRGISAREISQESPTLDMDWDRQEASNIAITAAMSTARLISSDTDLQKALIGLPIFTHAMIAVCASFLLKMAVAFGENGATNDRLLRLPDGLAEYGLNFHTKTALTNVERLVQVLGQAADNASQRHVARQVVTGLRELLQQFSPAEQSGRYLYSLPRNMHSSSMTVDVPRREADGAPARDAVVGREVGVFDYAYPEAAGNSNTETAPCDNAQQQDVFDLTGDLDWRFDDGFLLGVDVADSELAFL